MAVAVSIAHAGEPGGSTALSPSIAGCIAVTQLRSYAVTLPLLATSHGVFHFQVWLGAAFSSRRKELSAHKFWRHRLILFLCLPVLCVSSSQSPPEHDFRQRVKAEAIILGHGICMASFRQHRRCQHSALFPQMVAQTAYDHTFRLFSFQAASASFPSCAALLAITPAGTLLTIVRHHFGVRVLPHGYGHLVPASQELPLYDVISSICLQSQHSSFTIRHQCIRKVVGNAARWVVVTRDCEHP